MERFLLYRLTLPHRSGMGPRVKPEDDEGVGGKVRQIHSTFVMPGLEPGIHAGTTTKREAVKTRRTFFHQNDAAILTASASFDLSVLGLASDARQFQQRTDADM